MNKEEAKNLVKSYLPEYLQGKGININKTFHCLNPGHEDKHPSMSYDIKRNKVHCFSCGADYDIFDLIGIDYGLTDPKDIFKKAYELYNINTDNNQLAAIPSRKEISRTATNYTDQYKRWNDELQNSKKAWEYLSQRGISNATAAAYGLGYNAHFKTFNKKEDGTRESTTWHTLIIPTSTSSYVARNMDKPAEPEGLNRYRKTGAISIFNSQALYAAEKPVFIAEGELDALSIIEAGGEAVGLGSVSYINKLIGLLEKQKPTQPLILALDNDKEGIQAELTLQDELTKLQIPYFLCDILRSAKDPNEALLTDRATFEADIAEAERIPEVEQAALAEAIKDAYIKENSAASYIQAFKDGITASVNTPAISTGFYNLDTALDGGLYEGLYILGAISSLGKTTLMLQTADNLAKQGKDVLIFSLEMARTELMAKSISRLTYLEANNNRNAKTARGITAGARYAQYSEKEKAIIDRAIKCYQEDYAPHIFIHEGVGDIGVEKIKDEVRKHINATGRKPIVFIDYIQILAPYDKHSTDKQNMDKAVLELKRLARDEKLTVIGVSSFNRESYKAGGATKGKVSMTDYKESGALEYSADVLIGLEFTSAGNKDYNEPEEKRKDPRQIRLVILKNRNGKAWVSANFEYYPLFNYYTEA